jgi:hypothetical protein
MSEQSANLSLPFLASGQAQKHVTVNESLLRLDALVQLRCVSATTSAQPGAPSDGALYLLPTGKTGANWGAMTDGALAYFRDGVWEQLTPREGWLAYVCDADKFVAFSGSAWGDTLAGLARTAVSNTFLAGQTVQGASANVLNLSWADDGVNGVGINVDKISASPATSDDLFAFTVTGRDSAAASAIYGTFSCRIGSPTAGAHSGTWSFATRQSGVNATVIRFGAGIYHPSATGGDKGANTINFGAIYDDNSLLTCAPIEWLTDGAVDFQKWDDIASQTSEHEPAESKTPRRHEAARAFENLLADGFDPRDPDNFCARMKADRAVPGLFTEAQWRDLAAAGGKPDIGTMQSRVLLALDNLAVAFSGAMDRIAALEADVRGRARP